MTTIVPATRADIAAATESIVDAFAADPMIDYFFARSAEARDDEGVATFFAILLRARIALGMPVLLAVTDGECLGVAMGYTTEHGEWPEAENQAWDAFVARTPGFGERLAAYEALSRRYLPTEPHYYLGVLGVRGAGQGTGAGKALLEAFCRESADDPRSHGVYLETGSPRSLAFYERNGFEVRGEGVVDGCRIWCVYRAHDASRS